MTVSCPCCGHDVAPTAVAVDLAGNTLTVGWDERLVKLQPQQAVIMSLLIKARPRTTTFDDLIRGLWGSREPTGPENTIKVHISKLRKRILPFGISIRNCRHQGYRLEILRATA